jgi:hypothetical protein
MHTIQVQLTGRSVLIGLGIMTGVLGLLALVWWLVSPGYAIGIGVGLVLLVKGLFALLKPASE